jgi:hypothetical protein
MFYTAIKSASMVWVCAILELNISLFFFSSALAILLSTGGAALGGERWYFTASEIEIAYRYQQHFGRRLSHPLKPQDCYYGKAEFIAEYQGATFLAPCTFIHHTTRHLKEMIESGSARYVFPLDLDHAHLAIPSDLWNDTYHQFTLSELLPRVLREPTLVALYHTAEHLGGVNASASATISDWKAQRNVLGFFDGQSIKVLTPNPDGSGRERIENYRLVVTVSFLAHWLGEIPLSASGNAHTFDISFENE